MENIIKSIKKAFNEGIKQFSLITENYDRYYVYRFDNEWIASYKTDSNVQHWQYNSYFVMTRDTFEEIIKDIILFSKEKSFFGGKKVRGGNQIIRYSELSDLELINFWEWYPCYEEFNVENYPQLHNEVSKLEKDYFNYQISQIVDESQEYIDFCKAISENHKKEIERKLNKKLNLVNYMIQHNYNYSRDIYKQYCLYPD